MWLALRSPTVLTVPTINDYKFLTWKKTVSLDNCIVTCCHSLHTIFQNTTSCSRYTLWRVSSKFEIFVVNVKIATLETYSWLSNSFCADLGPVAHQTITNQPRLLPILRQERLFHTKIPKPYVSWCGTSPVIHNSDVYHSFALFNRTHFNRKSADSPHRLTTQLLTVNVPLAPQHCMHPQL